MKQDSAKIKKIFHLTPLAAQILKELMEKPIDTEVLAPIASKYASTGEFSRDFFGCLGHVLEEYAVQVIENLFYKNGKIVSLLNPLDLDNQSKEYKLIPAGGNNYKVWRNYNGYCEFDGLFCYKPNSLDGRLRVLAIEVKCSTKHLAADLKRSCVNEGISRRKHRPLQEMFRSTVGFVLIVWKDRNNSEAPWQQSFEKRGGKVVPLAFNRDEFVAAISEIAAIPIA